MLNELTLQIEDLISNNASDFEISKVFKNHIKNYKNSINTILETTGGKDFFVKNTKHTDKFLILLYKYILRKNFGSYQPMSTSIPITLVALGSYGREQLCIYSDIDLMILYEDVKGYNLRQMMEEFITLAWDCGLKLGSRVHELSEIQEAVKEDITIKTSIIESRMIYGSKYLWYAYEKTLNKIRKTDVKQFVLQKLEEHKQRLLKYPLRMEPNIKDGYGGLRESNMVYWMAYIAYGVKSTKDLINKEISEDEYKKYRSSLEYLFQVRNALHNISKKKLDLVNFDVLPELSSKLGFVNKPRYTKERQCMSKLLTSLHNIHFFSSVMVKKFTRILLNEKTSIKFIKSCRIEKNLYLHENKIYTSYNRKPIFLNNFLKELISLPNEVQAFDNSYIYYASKTKLPTKQTKELKKNIKTLLYKANLYPIIKLLYNANLFQAIIPISKKIINQPQFDGYHQLPVDIHSIKALSKIENIEDVYVKEIYNSLSESEKSVAKLAALLHDVGKGRTVDHHISGEKLFKNFASSLGLEESHIQMGATLVRYHNKMSAYAKNEDIYSEKIILSFTGLLKTKTMLKMLYVLTYADISAVGENVYNSSIASLLKELYSQSLPAFENEDLLNESARRIAKLNAIKNLKRYKELSPLMQRKINYISSNQIFLRLKADDILEMAIKAKDVKDYIYKIINEEQLIIRIIRKEPLNLGFLLGKLEFLNIFSMNIFKLYDEKKAFEITFSEKVEEGDLLYIKDIIENSFDMSKTTKLIKPLIKKSEIIVNCNHSAYLASLQVRAKDQKGLFAYIAKIFDDFNIEIESAKLATTKGYTRDLILIEKNGNFCANQEEIVSLICSQE
ncbi:protein-PII uridylyltransferase [Malaciobacter mytili]|uniref:Bifunctional uridylyltransferase/uridylyl-removing enzyme n=1 Tax=Malaciobacter mytili LMG 24559 TaxID=1032238 RepID=A0AAX2AFK9_9BACT|nr:HD domain-containing protein [Malaciobacter mytili]AXH16034.1 protein-P-II uridylyltransferase [Malaciobacter mytili LMG 24559]RXI48863.1 protein-PII uridylyltransferase [Malaciobacter mytili]RXK15782.1 protein-PII uridylyltransferase [Malaciobacter mytili LMG 24559]